MKTKQYLLLATIAFSGLFLSSCDDDDNKGGKAVNVTVVEAINLSGSDIFAVEVTEGTPKQLSTFIMPESAREAPVTFSFAGEPSGAIDLSKDGLITPLAKTAPEGAIPLPLATDTIVVTVEDGSGVYVKYPVRVISNVILVNSIFIINGESPTIAAGSTYDLSKIVKVNPDKPTNPTLSYSSQDVSIATVDDKGIITAVGKPGQTTYIDIKANDRSGKSTSCKITIVD